MMYKVYAYDEMVGQYEADTAEEAIEQYKDWCRKDNPDAEEEEAEADFEYAQIYAVEVK